jgi:hypothetical protein
MPQTERISADINTKRGIGKGGRFEKREMKVKRENFSR